MYCKARWIVFQVCDVCCHFLFYFDIPVSTLVLFLCPAKFPALLTTCPTLMCFTCVQLSACLCVIELASFPCSLPDCLFFFMWAFQHFLVYCGCIMDTFAWFWLITCVLTFAWLKTQELISLCSLLCKSISVFNSGRWWSHTLLCHPGTIMKL